MTAAERALIVDRFVAATFEFGQTIVSQGAAADAFYVVVAGTARVLKEGEDGQEIALNVVRSGESFGEIALLEETTRTATVRATTEVTVLKLDRAVFQDLVQNHPEIRARLELQVKHRHLHHFFRVYSAFARLPVDALRLLVSELDAVDVPAGTLMIHEGEEAGPLYVVQHGRLRAFDDVDGRRRYLRYLRAGDFFGEVSLLKGSKRTASVEAVAPCRLLMLRPGTFHKLLDDYPQFRSEIERRIAQYDYKDVARVPLDFADEILPAELEAHEKVGADQVEHDAEVAPEDAGDDDEAADPFASP